MFFRYFFICINAYSNFKAQFSYKVFEYDSFFTMNYLAGLEIYILQG